jgi:hypothetical protein
MAMKKKTAAVPIQIALRVTSHVVNRADTLAAKASAHPGGSLGRVTRSSILKAALLRGLDALEQEHK